MIVIDNKFGVIVRPKKNYIILNCKEQTIQLKKKSLL